MSSILAQAAIMLSKREVASVVTATGLIFKQLKKDSPDKQLEKVLISQKGGTWGEETVAGVGFPVLRSSNMRGKKVDVSDAAWCYIPATQAEAFSLQSGDILVTKSSGSSDLVGKAAIFFDPNDGNTYLFSNFTLRLRPDKTKVNPEYLAWFLRSPQSLMWRYEKQQNAVGLRNLQTKEYLNQVIPVPDLKTQEQVVTYLNLLELKDEKANLTPLPPPLTEQRRIVSRIEALAARVAEAQSLRREASEEADNLISATLAKIFGSNYPIAKPVSIAKSGLVLNRETRNPEKEPDIVFFYIDIAAVENGTGSITSPQRIMGQKAPSRARRVIHAGDVIISTVRPYLKAFALVPNELDDQICSTGFAVFTCPQNILPKFLLYQFFSPYFINQAMASVTGGHYPALNDKSLKAINIMIPDISEQRRLVAYLDGLQVQVSALRVTQAETEKELSALMPSILDKAFKGEL